MFMYLMCNEVLIDIFYRFYLYELIKCGIVCIGYFMFYFLCLNVKWMKWFVLNLVFNDFYYVVYFF